MLERLFKLKENNKNVIYSRVCELFDDIGVKIFCDNIQKELKKKNITVLK